MSSSHAAAAPAPRAHTPHVVARRPAPSPDGLSQGQRRGVIGGIALAHVAAIWGVLQVPAVREAVMETAPMFVELLAPPAPPAPPPPPVQPVVKLPPPVVIAAPAAAKSPAAFEVAPPPEVPAPPPPPEPVQQVVVEAAPAPPPPPKMIPASAVQYLDATPPEYPRASRRLSETGTVMLRVYIDERGLPATVQVNRTSGFPRLDEAAFAAVKKWRFKPYSENGQPTAGFAVIPVMFELEK